VEPCGALDLIKITSLYSQVMKVIKSISGKRVFEEAVEIEKKLWDGVF
jgi:hypothetical protein